MDFVTRMLNRFFTKPVDKKINEAIFNGRLKKYKELMAVAGNRHAELALMREYGMAFSLCIEPEKFRNYHPSNAAGVTISVPFYTSYEYLEQLQSMITKIQEEKLDFDDHWFARDIYQDVSFDSWISQYRGSYTNVEAMAFILRQRISLFFTTIEGIEEAEYGFHEALRRRSDKIIEDIFNLTYSIMTVQQKIAVE